MQHPIIDTHIHVWNFQRAEYAWLEGNTTILNRSYDIDELDHERQSAGITAGVLVQAANNFEDTDWMIEVAQKNNWINGVVGWLPLMDPGATEKSLQHKYAGQQYLKGVRHLIHDEPDHRWLLQENVVESLRIVATQKLTYDVVGILPEHIETAIEVAAKVPELNMVFDHLNQPPVATRERFGRWGDLIMEAARYPQFHAKISGLGTTSKNPKWSEQDISPYVEFILDLFGPDRCFCGGDWPVSLLAGSYSHTWSIYQNVIDSLLDREQREKVYHRNARQFYRLDTAL